MLSIPRPAFQCQSLGQTLGKVKSKSASILRQCLFMVLNDGRGNNVKSKDDLKILEVTGFLWFITFQAKPNCLIFLDNDTVVVGGESKEAQVWKIWKPSWCSMLCWQSRLELWALSYCFSGSQSDWEISTEIMGCTSNKVGTFFYVRFCSYLYGMMQSSGRLCAVS